MPLLQIQTSTPAKPLGLLPNISAELARQLGKPESYVLVSLTHVPDMLFGGTADPACFAVLKNIGTFTPAQTQKLSSILCERLSAALAVAPNRIYIEFVNAQGHLWGHDGDTFA
jgi:phenylpyruvate tautomerase